MGRGGVGAVMGSKKVKAIVLDESGTKTRQPADEARFKAAATVFNEGLRRHGVTGQGLPSFGTNVLTNILNEAGGYPTNNFQTGPLRGRREDQRRDPGRGRDRARRPGDPRLPPRLHHPVLRHLQRRRRAST